MISGGALMKNFNFLGDTLKKSSVPTSPPPLVLFPGIALNHFSGENTIKRDR